MADQNKFKLQNSKEAFNPGYILSEINKLYDSLNQFVDQLIHLNAIRISKERHNLIKDYHSAAKQTLLAYRGGPPIGKLTTEQQRDILVMVDEVLAGKRECVQFQLNRGCDGIKEVFSSKVFHFHK